MHVPQVNLHQLRTDFLSLLDEKAELPIEYSIGMRKVSTHDVDEQASIITAWQQLYDQIHPGKFVGGISEVWLEGLQFFNESTNRALRQSCMLWPGAIWFGFPNSQEDSFVCSSKVSEDCIAVCHGAQEFELRTPDNLDIIGVVILKRELESYLGDTPEKLEQLLPINRVLRVGAQKRRDTFQLIMQALTILEADPNPLNNLAVRKVMKDNLINRILDMLLTGEPVGEARYSQRNYCRIVANARECVMSNPHEPLTILDLCQRLYVSRRTLQNAFQAVLSINPITYLKAIRLNAVRRELISGYSDHPTVQDAAAAWGFWHMSQFSVDYQRLFDERPSITLQRRMGLPR